MLAKINSGILSIVKLLNNREEEFTFDVNEKWVADLYQEMLKSYINEEQNFEKSIPQIEIELNIKKKNSSLLENYLLITGHLQTNFNAPCEKCLREVPVDVMIDINACVIPKHLESHEMFKDQVEIFQDQQERDLFFYDKNLFSLTDLSHEYLFLNLPRNILHNTDCKGLCPECGIDLNEESCGHNSIKSVESAP